MSSKFHFSNVPYSRSEIPLASVVPNVRHPNQDTLCPYAAKKGVDYSSRPQQDFHDLLESSAESSFRAQITKLLTFFRDKSSNETLDLSAKKGKIYELKAPKTLFKSICKDEGVRTMLREGVEAGEDTYFVVGLRTFFDAVVGREDEERKEGGGEINVPAGDIIKGNTGIDVKDAADLKMSRTKKKRQAGKGSFRMEGEFVYAIEYRKILMNKLETEDPVLERDNIWRNYSDQRVVAGGAGPEFEVYEANIEDTDVVIEDGEKAPEESERSPRSIVAPGGDEYYFLGTNDDSEDAPDDDSEDALDGSEKDAQYGNEEDFPDDNKKTAPDDSRTSVPNRNRRDALSNTGENAPDENGKDASAGAEGKAQGSKVDVEN